MEIIPDEILKYAGDHSSPEPEFLRKVNRETHVKFLFPRMLSGHLQGRFLSMLVHMIRPKNILEIGTFTGYSAICLAEGLPPGGILHTMEINMELEEVIRKNISDSGFEPVIKLYMGDAMNILRELEVIYDLVFIDADKALYQSYYEKCLEKLCPGGFMVIDNVLWGGKVVYGQNVDKDTIRLRKFNDFLKEDNRVEKVVLPFRDGITLIRKLA